MWAYAHMWPFIQRLITCLKMENKTSLLFLSLISMLVKFEWLNWKILLQSDITQNGHIYMEISVVNIPCQIAAFLLKTFEIVIQKIIHYLIIFNNLNLRKAILVLIWPKFHNMKQLTITIFEVSNTRSTNYCIGARPQGAGGKQSNHPSYERQLGHIRPFYQGCYK